MEEDFVKRLNYYTLGSAKVYAYNTQTFGKKSGTGYQNYGYWTSYLNTDLDKHFAREIIDIHLL